MRYINPRAKRTRQKLTDGLINFVLEHGYPKLGVNALCRYADVGHTTFYRHYKSMDDLIVSLLQGAINDIFQQMAEQTSLYDETVAFWAYIEAHPRLFRFYTRLPISHPGRWLFYNATSDKLQTLLHMGNSDRVPPVIAVNHVIESIYHLLIQYLEDTDAYTPEQMATFFLDLVIRPKESKAILLRQGQTLAPVS